MSKRTGDFGEYSISGSPKHIRKIMLDACVQGRALNILFRAVAGEPISPDDQDFFHDWRFEVSTPEFFKAIERFTKVPLGE
jgi:hypothetical protein